MEKGRACEAYGAEVLKLTVGPELFYVLLRTLEETGFFNASRHTPFGIRGVEPLGAEVGREVTERYGRAPDAVVVTHAGGGNVTGTARGLLAVGCANTRVVGCSVDLSGLHMAGNTSLTAAISLARTLPRDHVVVVQETEYTGAGKHHNSQLAFARSRGIEVRRGDPRDNVPGVAIVLPERLDQVQSVPLDLDDLRSSYLRNAAAHLPVGQSSPADRTFLAADLKVDPDWVAAHTPDEGARPRPTTVSTAWIVAGGHCGRCCPWPPTDDGNSPGA